MDEEDIPYRLSSSVCGGVKALPRRSEAISRRTEIRRLSETMASGSWPSTIVDIKPVTRSSIADVNEEESALVVDVVVVLFASVIFVASALSRA